MFPPGQDGSGSEGRQAERLEETEAVMGGGLSAVASANSPDTDRCPHDRGAAVTEWFPKKDMVVELPDGTRRWLLAG
jgi:hypothetical protein